MKHKYMAIRKGTILCIETGYTVNAVKKRLKAIGQNPDDYDII